MAVRGACLELDCWRSAALLAVLLCLQPHLGSATSAHPTGVDNTLLTCGSLLSACSTQAGLHPDSACPGHCCWSCKRWRLFASS